MSNDPGATDSEVSARGWGAGELVIVGSVLFWLGFLAAVGAWFLPVTIDVAPNFEAGEFRTTQIANISLLQRQSMVFQAGAVALIVGTALYACGKLIAAIVARGRPGPPA